MKNQMVMMFFVSCLSIAACADELLVLAAASMTDVMTLISKLYEEQGGDTVRLSFASSGTMARQIEAGAPGDVFISANRTWVDFLLEQNLLLDESVCKIAGNSLVLIAPRTASFSFSFGEETSLADSFQGRLAIGDTRSVPAGMYAKQALDYYGWYDELRPRFVPGDSVRRVLLYVECGEVDAGIVYATDAASSKNVRTVVEFPEESHMPIGYFAGVCADSESPDAAYNFLAFIKSPESARILLDAGFRLESEGGVTP